MKLILPLLMIFIFSCSTPVSKKWNGYSLSSLPSRNIVFEAPGDKLAPDEMWFIVEVPKGEIHKYELRTASGTLIMDRVQCPRQIGDSGIWVQSFPAHYGISPGRLNVDGDPLDLLVLGNDDLYSEQIEKRQQQAQRVRVIGLLKMEECGKVPCKSDKEWLQDWKILAVDTRDPLFNKVITTDDLSKNLKSTLSNYFSNYKGQSSFAGKFYPTTRANEFLNKKEALDFIAKNFVIDGGLNRKKEVAECQELYQKTYEKKEMKTELDPNYLNCLQRVHSEYHFPRNPYFKDFIKYSAYQLLLSLGNEKANRVDSLEQMDNRRKAKSEYFRFVTTDSPVPGTGDVIFEWVRTKNRNKGCAADFPPQHYDGIGILPEGL